jgi:hypothetical protein
MQTIARIFMFDVLLGTSAISPMSYHTAATWAESTRGRWDYAAPSASSEQQQTGSGNRQQYIARRAAATGGNPAPERKSGCTTFSWVLAFLCLHY